MQSTDTKFDNFYSRDLALMYYKSYSNWNSKQFWLEILTIKTCQTEAYASRESLLDFLRTSDTTSKAEIDVEDWINHISQWKYQNLGQQ